MWTAMLIPLVLLLSAAPLAAQDAPRQGGILKVAIIGEPPTLDTHSTTATIAYQIAWHVMDLKSQGLMLQEDVDVYVNGAGAAYDRARLATP